MTRPISMDLRERATTRLASGQSVRQAAAALEVAPSSVVKWSQRLRATGSCAPAKIGGRRPRKIVPDHEAWPLARIEAPFTLRGLVSELAARGLRVDYRTVWKAVASEQCRPDVARRRVRWKRRQKRIDPRRLVFIDETWAPIAMGPTWRPCAAGPPGARA